MWKMLHASIAGTSHAQLGTPCQDASQIALIPFGVTDEILVLACADGAGSSKFACEASTAACNYLCSIVEKHVQQCEGNLKLDTEVAKEWVDGVHNHLLKLAIDSNESKREWACTFLGAILTEGKSLFLQIGDGAIVRLSEPNDFHTVFWPDNGEYANQTNFITDDNYGENIHCILLDERTTGIALLTDGIQRIALDYKLQDAHAPFFRPMFEALRQVDEATVLEEGLKNFLASDGVNKRTDDDKTLLIARWC